MGLVKDSVRRHALNARGWTTKSRIVVLESDDWGAYRTPNLATLDYLKQQGVQTERCHYMSNDHLATDEDLEALFEVLRSVKDGRGAPAVLTANSLMFNPNFEHILQSEYTEYAAHTLEASFARAASQDARYTKGLSLWKEGMDTGVFRPQLHGAEHLQIPRWLRQLRAGHPLLRGAAERGMWGISNYATDKIEKSLQAALHSDNLQDQVLLTERIKAALLEFERVFGYPSRTFIPANYTWFESLEPVLASAGVRTLQSGSMQNLVQQNGQLTHQRAYTGQRKSSGLMLTVRNVYFEPSDKNVPDPVGSALKQIATAFLWHKPAVLSTHRVNYVGALHPENSARGLHLLSQLLKEIVRRWPNVQFLSSDQLSEQMWAPAHQQPRR